MTEIRVVPRLTRRQIRELNPIFPPVQTNDEDDLDIDHYYERVATDPVRGFDASQMDVIEADRWVEALAHHDYVIEVLTGNQADLSDDERALQHAVLSGGRPMVTVPATPLNPPVDHTSFVPLLWVDHNSSGWHVSIGEPGNGQYAKFQGIALGELLEQAFAMNDRWSKQEETELTAWGHKLASAYATTHQYPEQPQDSIEEATLLALQFAMDAPNEPCECDVKPGLKIGIHQIAGLDTEFMLALRIDNRPAELNGIYPNDIRVRFSAPSVYRGLLHGAAIAEQVEIPQLN